MHSVLNCHNKANRVLPIPIRKKSGERGGHYRYRVSGHAPTVPHSTDEDDQKGRIRFQQDGAPSHYIEEDRE
jgi:hypothetical protein